MEKEFVFKSTLGSSSTYCYCEDNESLRVLKLSEGPRSLFPVRLRSNVLSAGTPKTDTKKIYRFYTSSMTSHAYFSKIELKGHINWQ